jgi:hypothetical protein
MFSKVAESAQKMTFFYVGIMIVLASVVAQCILLVYAELAYHNCKCGTNRISCCLHFCLFFSLHGFRSCSHMF